MFAEAVYCLSFTMHATIFLQSGEVLKLHYLEETVNKDQGSRFLMELVSNSLGAATTISLPQLHM